MARPTEEDIKSLNEFWHWADNEKPEPSVFELKAGQHGSMTEEAQEALEAAYNIIESRDARSMGMCSRAALKPVSFAILYAWMVLHEPPKQPYRDPLNLPAMRFELAAAEQDFSEEMHREAYSKHHC